MTSSPGVDLGGEVESTALARRDPTGRRPDAGRARLARIHPTGGESMKNRRGFLLALTTGLVALGLIAGSALADELFGVITKVDVEGKKITVMEKDTDKEVEVKITDETEYVGKKGAMKFDLEKIAKGVEKQKDAGKKGIAVKVVHEKAVASKIYPAAKKKEAEKTDK